jgi:hypothetical protein
MRQTLTVLVLAAALLPCVPAQPTVPANFTVSIHAFGISASGESMGVDARGFTYILDRTNLLGADSITLVRPDGTVVPNFISGIGAISQIAYNPTDGGCYAASYSPLLPVVNSMVSLLDPNTGAVQVGNVAAIVEGLTIDDTGRFYIGTNTGLSGPGLYSGSPGGNLTYHGPGFGRNRILQSLARTGDVLIGDANEVRRWTPMALVPVAYWSRPVTTTSAPVNSIARSPFNQLGVGAIIGHNVSPTFFNTGVGSAFPGSLTSGANAPFATENYNAPLRGLQSIASGIDHDLYWLTDVGISPVVGKDLYRVTQDITPTTGHLIVNVNPNPMGGSSVQFNVYGPTMGGDPFLLGTVVGPLPGPPPQIFVPPFGSILDIFHPAYVVLLDGVGVFLPPNPLAIIPPGGNFQLTLTAPPAGGLPFVLQALTLSGEAPNGYFYISNLESVVLP